MRSFSSHIGLIFLSLLTGSAHAGIYYDTTSCKKYDDLLNKGFKSAIELNSDALQALGQRGSGGALWTFPDSEVKDMAARIFGVNGASDSKANINLDVAGKYDLIKTSFQYIHDNFGIAQSPFVQTDEEVGRLKDTDVLVYCDLNHLKQFGSNWQDPNRAEEGIILGGDYDSCKKGKTLAITQIQDGTRQVMTLCQMPKWAKMKYNIIADRSDKWLKKNGGFKDLCNYLVHNKKWEVDYYSFFDLTLLHELTHAVTGKRVNPNDPTKGWERIRTADEGKNGGYEWDAIHTLSTGTGWRNADSYAYFGLGAWMLKNKQTRIQNNACLTQIDNYRYGSQAANVDNNWAPPAKKRGLSLGATDVIDSLVMRAASTSSSSSSRRSSVTSSSTSRNSSVTTTASRNSTLSSSATSSLLASKSKTGTASGSATSTSSRTSKTSSCKASSSSKAASTAPGSTTSKSSSAALGSSSKSSTGPITTSSTTGLPANFFSATPTVTPASGFVLCSASTTCTKPTPTWLETITPAPTGFFINTIPDLKAVPTKKVKQNENDDNSKAIIFVKLELPKDKCDPLPKPKAGGFLGVVANIANKAMDTVMDAACHMEFPVIDGNMPDWLELTKFPGLTGYTEPGSTPNDSNDPSKSASSSKSSSSSTCKPSGVPQCKATAVVSGSKTVSTATSCTTVSACSTAGATDVTKTTISCSATGFAQCKGTDIISGTSTKSYATTCSTITACSGTATTSISKSTVAPTGTDIPHPEPEASWLDHEECFQSLMENSATTIDNAAFGSCLGTSMDPVAATGSSSVGTSSAPKSTGATTTSSPASKTTTSSTATKTTGASSVVSSRSSTPVPSTSKSPSPTPSSASASAPTPKPSASSTSPASTKPSNSSTSSSASKSSPSPSPVSSATPSPTPSAYTCKQYAVDPNQCDCELNVCDTSKQVCSVMVLKSNAHCDDNCGGCQATFPS